MPSNQSTKLRGVIYCRMSTDRQEASIGEQQEWARRACPAEGVEAVREFKDEAIPGSEIARRPGLQAMLAFVEAEAEAGRPLDVLVAWDADRVSRADSLRTGATVLRLVEAGVTRLLTADGWVDWEDATDRVLYNLKQDLSREGYSRGLSATVARTVRERALKGRWLGSKPPLGYVVVDGKLAPGPAEEVALVRKMFSLYADTPASAAEVASALNAEGHRTAGGKPWTRVAVLKVLENRRYLGEARWAEGTRAKYTSVTAGGAVKVKDFGARRRRQERRGGRRLPVRVNRPEDVVVVPNAHPALVDAEAFARAQSKRLSLYRKRTSPRGGAGAAPLSGLAVCGDCGGPMYGCLLTQVSRGKKYTYSRYICGTSRRRGKGACPMNAVDQGDLLRSVLDALVRHLAAPQALNALRAEAARVLAVRAGADGEARARLRGRLADLDRDLATAGRNLALTPDDLRGVVADHVRQLRAEQARVASDLAAIDRPAEEPPPAAVVEAAIAMLPRLAEEAASAPPALVRNALAPLVAKVTVVFSHTAEGKRRTHVEGLEIEYTEDLALLLGLPRRGKSELYPAGRRR